MGREVRMVPKDWQHPKHYHIYRNDLEYCPQHESNHAGGYESLAAEWDGQVPRRFSKAYQALTVCGPVNGSKRRKGI